MSAVIKLSSPETREFWSIPILWEDSRLLAVDKPSGLLTSPDRYDPARPNLMKLLHQGIRRGARWAQERSLNYLANAHRLDFETSGVLLLAKDKPALIHLANQFGTEKPEKRYLALAQGVPRESSFEIQAGLAPHPTKPWVIRVDPKRGKKACTRFETLEQFLGYTLLAAFPLTGRTHQIRVHLKHAGLPLVGDSVYGGQPLLLSRLKRDYRPKRDEPEKPLLGRVGLHAERLSFFHPATNQPVLVVAPWPNDLLVAVKYLRRFAPATVPRT